MAVFAYENGKLVLAEPIDLSKSRLGEGALAALRERAIDLVEAPLFPVGWVGEPVPDGTRELLIALDPSGQIVTVDVLARLSADELLASLAAAGRHADNSSDRLSDLYAPGAEAFAADWRAFVDACPPSAGPGPRLFLIVFGIDEEVRPAVDALCGAGVDVRVASVIASGTKVFISLEQVRPRITALSNLLGVARRRVSVEAGKRRVTWEASVVGADDADASVRIADPDGSGGTHNDSEMNPGHGPQEAAAPKASGEQTQAPDSHHVEIRAQDSGPGRSDRGDARPGTEGIHRARFGAQPATPAPDGAEALAGFRLPAEDEEASRRNRSRLRDILAGHSSEARSKLSEASGAEEALSTFGNASRPPVAFRAEDSGLPTASAPDSAASADTAGATAAPAVPSRASRSHQRQDAFAHRSEARNGTEPETARAVRKPLRRRPVEPAEAVLEQSTPAPAADIREAAATYAQSLASRRRAEQVLWDEAAPSREEGTERLISESSAASTSADAVADAAERDYLSPAGRLVSIAGRHDTPINLHWVSRRRDIDLHAQITSWGAIVCSNGAAYSDPTQAAREQSGLDGVDGWKVWRADDGRTLGEL